MSAHSWFNLAKDLLASSRGDLARPYRIFLVVTKSCQSRCQHCKIWQEEIKDELTLNELEAIAKNNSWLKWLNISGGEPTDRDDLPNIIGAFKKYCPDLVMANFTTNGLLPDKIVKQVEAISTLRIPKFHINVSIDGPETVNDSLRGVRGDFKAAVETYKRVRRIRGIESSVAMTLFRKNAELIEETFQSIKAEIPDLKSSEIHLNIPHMSSHYYGNDSMNVEPDNKMNEYVANFYSKHGRGFSPLSLIERIYEKQSKKYLYTGRTPIPCSAANSSVYISEKGVVYPCTIWDKPMGSLREHEYKLARILEMEDVAKIKKKISHLDCPQCWTPCEAFPSIIANLPKSVL